ncbi:TPA: hypothetical protein N0F65_008472 [Lagenidium giganteum]|uniref:C2H2-type domain-containing protein n=1 Tax=Lagenidium giganteum TaxID=4803 RepID=A0AAV2Z5M3_9STRA|nr:TPA: hypothetical protein N0F65_008472 [Lagenidium giganteum]
MLTTTAAPIAVWTPISNSKRKISLLSPSKPVDSANVHSMTKDSTPSYERRFKCDQPGCGRRFHRKFTLNEHIKTHTGVKPFKCPVAGCEKLFSTSGNLARHKRLHPSIRFLPCPLPGCKRTFVADNKLRIHLKSHHAIPIFQLQPSAAVVDAVAPMWSGMGDQDSFVELLTSLFGDERQPRDQYQISCSPDHSMDSASEVDELEDDSAALAYLPVVLDDLVRFQLANEE